MYYHNDILAHHGILGQKWGVRRYQNKDGSLTNAGKKRYGVQDYRDIYDRSAKVDSEWFQTAEKYWGENSSKAKTRQLYFDKYLNDPSDENYVKLEKAVYEYGYDYGRKTGRDMVKKYGNDAVNFFLDQQLHEGSYYSRDYDQHRLQSLNAITRFAKACGDYEVRNL